jgi:hypothetical protein
MRIYLVDIEKSTYPYAIPITNANRDLQYLDIGNEGDVLTVSGGTIQWEPSGFNPSCYCVSQAEVSDWNDAYSWGNHSLAGYELQSNKVTSFTLINNVTYPTTEAVWDLVNANLPQDGQLIINTFGIASGGGIFTANQASTTNININVPHTNLTSFVSGNDVTINSSTGSSTTFTIPTASTVNDGVLSIVASGIASGSVMFTANQATSSSLNIYVPPTNLTSEVIGSRVYVKSSTGDDTYFDLPALSTPPNNGELYLNSGVGLSGFGTFTADQATNTSVTFSLSHLGIEDLTDPEDDMIMYWDNTNNQTDWLEIGSNLSITSGVLNATNTVTRLRASGLDPFISGDISFNAGSNIAISQVGSIITFDASFTPPTVNDGTLTLTTTSDLTGSATFTANQSSNTTFTVGLSTSIQNAIAEGIIAYSWGNHASAGYLTTESDPTVPSHVKAITATDISNWDDAYSWGDHAGLYRPVTWTPDLQEVTDEGFTTTHPFVKTVGTTHKIVTNPIAFHVLGSPASTGCLVVKHPIVAGATMVEMEITVNGYESSNARLIKYYLTFYHASNTINPTWNTRAIVIGNNMPTGATTVRVGIDGTDIVVVLGETTTNWNNSTSGLAIEVDKVRLSHNNANNASWDTGWSITRNITDTSGYSPLITLPTEVVATQSYISSLILSGTYSMGVSAIAANSQSTIGTTTVTGAVVNNTVEITQPASALIYKARVTASNTVTIYAINPTGSPINTVSETLQIKVFK